MYTFELEQYMDPRENINIIYCTHDMGCEIHRHEFVELIFIEEGMSTHYIDGQRYDARPGDLIFVNYGQTHSFETNDGISYYNLLYVPEFFSAQLINSESIYEIFEISLFREFENAPRGCTQMACFRGGEYLKLRELVEDMEKEFVRKETGYRSILNGYSRVLFSKILRKLKSGEKRSGEKDSAQKCVETITAECLAYIDSRCFEKISLKEIAERTFYNPSYLSRMFRMHCGVSLSEYIKEKRMAEAGRLLKDTDLSNEEIMNRIGYTDKKQFYSNFKEVYGQTPSSYRKNSLP